jgi:hypothetical protein
MNMFHTMIASLTFVVMCFEAGAADSLKTGGASPVVADLGSAAGNAALNRDATSKANRVSGSESPRGAASMGGAPKGRHPAAVAQLRNSLAQPRGVGNAPRIRTDPRRVLLIPKARGPLAASTRALLPAMKATATARDSTISAPHLQALGRIGGPVYSRASRGATIDGTQLHHKF